METIAFPCGSERISMPLGIIPLGGEAFFRVFRGASLLRALPRSRGLMLLLPNDPELFLDSLEHRLERSLEWRGDCPLLGEEYGVILTCTRPLLHHAGGPAYYYSCKYRVAGGAPTAGYTRLYGCLVELLVHATKAAAGAVDPSPCLIEAMLRCMVRAGGARGARLAGRARAWMLRVLGPVQEAWTRSEAL